jgi:carbon-monoxide dehydrogenase small subunit
LRIQVTVNGTAHESEVEDRTLLVHYIRDGLGLTGTNIGCDTSSCGSCTLHVDGESVKSCTMLAAQADGTSIMTIEGLATNGELHPMQKAFQENHGLQCGYCTPGMVMTAIKLLEANPAPTEPQPGTRNGVRTMELKSSHHSTPPRTDWPPSYSER